MKKTIFLLQILLVFVLVLSFAACEEKVDLENITISDVTVEYDGSPHTIEIAGELPEGYRVEYVLSQEGEVVPKAVAVGVYAVTAKIYSPKDTVDKILVATLTIKMVDFDSLFANGEWDDIEVSYTGQTVYTLPTVVVPQGFSMVATLTKDGEPCEKALATGQYEATVTFSYSNSDVVLKQYHKTVTILKNQIDLQKLATELGWVNTVVPYNGAVQSLTIDESRLPEGVSVTYRDNSTLFGSCENARLTFSLSENYEKPATMRFYAVFTVEKCDLSQSIIFEDLTVEKTSGTVEFSAKGVPDWVDVSYSDGPIFSEFGTYTVTATFTVAEEHRPYCENIQSKTAVLTILRKKFEVTFNSNGGEEIDSQTVPYEGFATKQVPHREGYEFIAWIDYISEEVFDFSTPITANVELHAQWRVIKYVVSVDVNGGNLPVGAKTEFSVTYNAEFKSNLSTPIRTGYSFIGWYVMTPDNKYHPMPSDNSWTFTNGDDRDFTIQAAWAKTSQRTDSLVLSVTKGATGKLVVDVDGIGFGQSIAYVVMCHASYYIEGDTCTGLSQKEYSNSVYLASDYPKEWVVASYICGEHQVFEFNRYDADGFDQLYCKAYIVSPDGTILKGPMYVTDIEAERDFQSIEVSSKKGLLYEDSLMLDASDNGKTSLGIDHAVINVVVSQLVWPNERIVNGKIVKVEPTQQEISQNYLIPFESNGETFWFRLPAISDNDYRIKRASFFGQKVTLILLNNYDGPSFMRYDGVERSKVSNFTAPNTSTLYGEKYWIACLEFLAERYSRGTSVKDNYTLYDSNWYGVVETFVVGNEIDYGNQWNSMTDYNTHSVTAEEYYEEYYRTLRLANNAVKKYDADNQVLVSLTNCWFPGRTDWNSGGTIAGHYPPHYMMESLNSKSKAQGDFDWGIAAHPYSVVISSTNLLKTDTETRYGLSEDPNRTAQITFANLEALQLFLEQSHMRCNGEVRPVYITEGGINSSTSTEKIQAAVLAYSYFKSESLSCVKAFIHYKGIDTPEEGLTVGMMTKKSDGTMYYKAAYEVYVAMNTNNRFIVANKYLPYISYYQNGRLVEGASSYYSVMNLFGGSFDWASCWPQGWEK